jgi:hypothetical protein
MHVIINPSRFYATDGMLTALDRVGAQQRRMDQGDD